MARYRKVTKPQAATLHKRFAEWLQSTPERQPPGAWHDWKLKTIYGPLGINTPDPRPTSLFAVFTRFDDQERSLPLSLNRNWWPGKWNHYISRSEIEQYGLEECVSSVIRQFESILAAKQEPVNA